jgi:hypothetical protein
MVKRSNARRRVAGEGVVDRGEQRVHLRGDAPAAPVPSSMKYPISAPSA